MPELLSSGGVYVMTTNTVYSLPPVVVRVQSNASIEASLLETTAFTTLANSTTGTETGAMFVRCTTGTTSISIKRLD